MNRRAFFLFAVVHVLAVASLAVSPAAARTFRVGVLCPISCDSVAVKTFRQALSSIGQKNEFAVVFEERAAAADLNRLPALADELVKESVDVIYTTWGTATGAAAKRATASVPVVVGSAGDLAAAGIVKSLSRPEANVTGITSLALELEGKRVELVKDLLPKVSRIAVFRDSGNPYSVLAVRRQRLAAAKLGIEIKEMQVAQAGDVERAFASVDAEGVEALCVHAYVPVLASRDKIVALAAARRLPGVYPLRDYADAGGLMSYGASLNDNARRAAAQVGKVLAGAKPAEIPVEQSTRVELVINLNTAKALGITMPQSILARADEVIE